MEEKSYRSPTEKINDWNTMNNTRDAADLEKKLTKICAEREFSSEETQSYINKGITFYNANSYELPTRHRYATAHFGEHKVNNFLCKSIVRLQNLNAKSKTINHIKSEIEKVN